jgi:tetratricopeptide (TPR) repeat protein
MENMTNFWDDIQREEKLYCAESLLSKGEMCLLKGDMHRGIDLFNRVLLLDPQNPQTLFRQGLALFEFAHEEKKPKALFLSCKKFKAAAALQAQFFENWVAWGNALSMLGNSLKDHHYFCQAEEKYRRAIALSQDQPSEAVIEVLWDYGKIWLHIANHSQEALDLQMALEAFHKAALLQETLPPEFWLDYGRAHFALATRINDLRLFVKAINCFKHAISLGISSYEGWLLLSNSLRMLYTYTHDEDHFVQANDCFAQAALTKPQEGKTWVEWAEFLLDCSRRTRDVKKLHQCLEKCERAAPSLPKDPLLLGIWSEALALLGSLTEKIDLLCEAQNKIILAVEVCPDHVDLWYSYGICLQSLGHYFSDIDYYYQAIEKFQQGLSIDRTSHRLWHALANAYSLAGQMQQEEESLERACRFYLKAIDLSYNSFYVFDYALTLAKWGELTHNRELLETAVCQFERALNMQKNAIYLHPDWLFHYAVALDALGDFHEEASYYRRCIEILAHVLTIDPDFPSIHYKLALAYTHLGELTGETDAFYRSIHHFRLALRYEEENDTIVLDWGITLIHLAEHSPETEAEGIFREAEQKLLRAAKGGNASSYYYLAGLYSLTGYPKRALPLLEKAREFEALPLLEEILQDDWLDNLRSDGDFRNFLMELEKNPHFYEERGL